MNDVEKNSLQCIKKGLDLNDLLGEECLEFGAISLFWIKSSG
jgi:hypothetical protein